ncbi:MAG: AI-2E family transporter [Gammaproteobacteria bacterium SHHR-1]|uniref:AI-2E family transporter n=1 Tax=Magnetovirga frankeli TaxID=947516 RepID=UPI00129395D4|nr:AI-2E family transporter [gamma proteobacterium SS-5]
MATQSSDSRHWYYLALALLGGWLVHLLSPILAPFLISALLAYLGDPLCDRLEEKGLSRTLAVSLVFIALLLALLLMLLLVLPQLEAQISYLLKQFPGYLEWLRNHVLPWAQKHLGLIGQLQDLSLVQELLAEHWREAGGLVKGLLSSVSSSGTALLLLLMNLVLVPVLTFYLLRDWDLLTAGVRVLLPRRFEPTLVRLAQESDAMLGAFIRGQLMVMLALGMIYATGLWLLGLELALLIGMIAGVVSFVPYLGLILGILMAGVAAVLQFHAIEPLLGVALVFVVGQVVEGAVLTPKFVGDQIGMHPVAVIFAVMAGGHLFGFFGVLLALPAAAVFMVWLRHAVGRYKLSRLY